MTRPVPTATISGPQAWLGSDMAQRDDWVWPLRDAEIAELDHGRGFLLLRGLPVADWGFDLSQ